MRLESYASSDGKDAIQYCRASSDMVLNGPMVLERRTERNSCSEFGNVIGSVSTRNNSQSDLPFVQLMSVKSQAKDGFDVMI